MSVWQESGKGKPVLDAGLERDSAATVIEELIAVGKTFSSRNWLLGTAGNFSSIVCREPLQLVITATGARKGALTAADFLCVNELGQTPDVRRPVSVEAPIHCAIISERDAGVVLHTHSIWSTMLSDLYADAGGLAMDGFEMLKGLAQVESHQHCEWVPIVENSDDCIALSRVITNVLAANPGIHGILLRRYGLYTWGVNVDEATRHVEILEFLFEVFGRQLHILRQMGMNQVGAGDDS